MLASQLHMFGANIYLLIGLLIAGGVALLGLIAGWTSLKIVLFRRAQRRAEQMYRSRRAAPDGTPYPPTSRGICEHCGKRSDEVFHLPTGERLCREHYAALRAARTAGPAGGD